jgi:hypothetical protein
MTKSLLVQLVGALAVVATASADTLPAIGGHAWVPSDQACFYSSWSRVRNSCSTTKKLLISGRNPAQTNTVITLSAAAESTGGGIPPSCRGVANDPANGLVAQTAATLVLPGPGLTRLGQMTLSADATFHFDCDITADSQQGFGLALVHWTPGEADTVLKATQLVASPAITGHAWIASSQGCFSSSWASVSNTCTTTEKFLVPMSLHVPATNRFNEPWGLAFTAAAENDAGHSAGPTCRVVMNDPANGLVAATSPVKVGKGPTLTSMGNLSAVAGTTPSAHLDCDMVPRGQSGLGLSAVGWQIIPTL